MSSAITEASYFAKIAHSFLLADLGNPKLPNMLLEEEELRYFLSGQSRNINRLPNGTLSVIPSPKEDFAFLYMLPPPNSTLDQDLVPLNKSWDAFKDRFHKDSKLETKTATIYKQYSCSGSAQKELGEDFRPGPGGRFGASAGRLATADAGSRDLGGAAGARDGHDVLRLSWWERRRPAGTD